MAKAASIENIIQSCDTQACLAIEDNIIINANQPFANLLGHASPESLMGRSLSDITSSQEVLSPGVHRISTMTTAGYLLELEATSILWPETTNVWLIIIRECPVFPNPVIIGNTSSTKLLDEYYKGVIEDQTDLVDRFLPDGTITYANQALCRYFNRSQEELIGWSFYEQLPDDDLHQLLKILSSISPENPVVDFNHRITTTGGEERLLHWTNRGIFDSEGKLVEYLAFGQDITEARRAAETLSSNERLFRAAFENAGIGMLLLTPDGQCIEMNRYAQDITGYDATEMNLLAAGSQDSTNQCIISDLVNELMNSGRDTLRDERCCTSKSGTPFWVRVFMSTVRDESNRLVNIIAAIEDITDYHNTLNSLKDAEQFSRTVIQAVGESIIVYDRNTNILAWNRRIEEATGICSADAIGRHVVEVLPFVANSPDIASYKDALQGIESRNVERVYTRPGIGNEEYVEMTFSPHYNSAGEVIGVIQLIRDITAAKHSQAKLHEAMQDLENAYQLQKEFLNNVTHDVRTPLTAVQGYVKMLLEGVAGEISELQSQLLQRVLVSSDQLLDMVNSILEISKSRHTKLILVPKACKPDLILRRAVSSISPQAKEKGIQLIFKRTECGTALYDQQKLTMILLNILANAVKYTEHGIVEASISKYDKGVEIIITDTGTGISGSRLANIFDEFTQLKSSRKQKYAGFGLGLSIVANMIELMHGSLVVSSEVGTGTAFTIRIPELDAD